MKPVLVRWHDAMDHPEKWADAADVDEWGDKACTIESYGLLVKKTDKYVTLAGDWDAEDGDFGRVTKIPTAWVDEIKELT